MEKTTVTVSFTLIGDDFDANHVTQVLGVQPTVIQNRNDLLKTGKPCGYTAWEIETQLEESTDTEVQLNKVIAPFFDKVDLLNRLRKECNAEWQVLIVVYSSEDGPPMIGFSREQLKFLGAIEAKVDFDFYVLALRKEIEISWDEL